MSGVAIIGGGITGLTAAFELSRRGVPFRLYEAGPRVGGPIQSRRDNGYLAEFGPNTILETSPRILELVRELGLESRRIYSDPRAANRYIAKNGRPVPLPDSPLSFLRTPLFSGMAKLRLAWEPFISRSDPQVEESVAEFVLRRLGREFLDYAINPMVGGVYAGDPARLSVKHAFPKLHALEQRYGSLIGGQILGARERKRRGTVSKQNAPKFSFDEGLEVLPLALRQRLSSSLQLRAKISRIRRSERGWRVCLESRDSAPDQEHAAVIIAIPACDLSRIAIEGITAPSLAPMREIYHPPVASVVLGFRRPDVTHPLDGFGVLVPQVEGMKILGTIFSSSLFPGRAPEGHVTLTSYLGGARAPDLALASDGELITQTVRDLRALLGANGQPTFIHCHRFTQAIPQYNVGFGRYKQLMAGVEKAAPGVFIGGHCRDGISLGDSIASGFEIARRAMDHLAATAGLADANAFRPSAALK